MTTAAIVGGGIGGMVTALLLAKQGVAVSLFEQSSRLGGRLAFTGKNGDQIDQGPTIVLLPETLIDILSECGIDRTQYQLIACSPINRIQFADGTLFHKYQDIDQQAEEINRIFPGEADNFLRYMQRMDQVFEQAKLAFIDKSFVRRKAFFTPSNLNLLGRMQIYRSVRGFAQQFFKDPRLVDAFSLQTLYIGGSPLRTPALYSFITYSEHKHGVWYVKGGYASLVPLLERELHSRGVKIELNSEVSQIKVNSAQRCEGLMVNGRIQPYDHVIYNGDLPGLAALVPHLKRRSKTYTASSGCLLIYAGIRRRWPDAPAHQFCLPHSFEQNMRDIFEHKRISANTSYYIFNPVQLDHTAAAEGKSVLYILIPVPSGEGINWQEESQRIVDAVLQDADEKCYPGLQDHLDWIEVRTPADASAAGLYQGGGFGIAPTLLQSGVFRPQFQPYPIQNLYAVGASIHPGGGIPIVMQGAATLAKYILSESIS